MFQKLAADHFDRSPFTNLLLYEASDTMLTAFEPLDGLVDCRLLESSLPSYI